MLTRATVIALLVGLALPGRAQEVDCGVAAGGKITGGTQTVTCGAPQEDIDALKTAAASQEARLAEILAAVQNTEGLSRDLLLALARRINDKVDDPETAKRELQRAVEIAEKVIADGLKGSGLDDLADETLRRAGELTAEGKQTEARDEVLRALEDSEAGAAAANARLGRLLNAALEQDILARDVEGAASRVVRMVELQTPDPTGRFDALRGRWIEWYERGQDKGLAFDLEVSIELARLGSGIAADADERGEALNRLAVSLTTLGEREPGTTRLEQAIAAHRAALEERTRDRVPLSWATTQNNLGTVLSTLGEREPRNGWLEQAIAAYRAALEEQARDSVPLDWARTQVNLGNALLILGGRGSGTVRLEEAVAAFRAALGEFTRDRAPLQWATAQMSLGNALRTLGERETGTARLQEAVAAYRAALEESTRDRVPFDWAGTQMNLGVALTTIGERETGTARLQEAVAAHRAALQEWTRDRVPLQWALAQNGLGIALAALAQRASDTASLDEAIDAFDAALAVYTRDGLPLEWAGALGNLALTEGRLAERTGDLALVRDALAKLVEAEQVLRDGGDIAGADRFARAIPDARALVERLTP